MTRGCTDGAAGALHLGASEALPGSSPPFQFPLGPISGSASVCPYRKRAEVGGAGRMEGRGGWGGSGCAGGCRRRLALHSSRRGWLQPLLERLWSRCGASGGALFADGSRDGMDENGTHAVLLLCCLDTKTQTKEQQGHRAQPRKEAGPHSTHTPGTKRGGQRQVCAEQERGRGQGRLVSGPCSGRRKQRRCGTPVGPGPRQSGGLFLKGKLIVDSINLRVHFQVLWLLMIKKVTVNVVWGPRQPAFS